MGPIIDAIWQLPWYKILVIAVVDDAILLIKTWPLWVVIIIILILRLSYTWWDSPATKRKIKRWKKELKK